MFQRLFALFKRDFFVTSSYKVSFVLYWIHAIAFLIPFFFIARMFGEGGSPHLLPYGGDYFVFVLIGLGLRRYLAHSLHSLSGAIGEEQGFGTLEALLATPTSSRSLFSLLSLLSFLYATLNLLFYLSLGVVLFQVRFVNPNFLGAFCVLVLTTLTFFSFGFLAASFTLVFKKSSIIEPFFEGFSSFLGGVYFPMTLFPEWIQRISECMPMTYALRALRLSLLRGVPVSSIGKDLLVLSLLSVALFPLSLWVLGKAITKAKRAGSLVHY